MLGWLPPLPDALGLGLWAGGGALGALGFWVLSLVGERNATYGDRVVERPRAELPGAPSPEADAARSKSPLIQYALPGALVGALMGWGFEVPVENRPQIELILAAIALPAALFALLRVLHDRPAVGEAPREDPENPPANRRWEALSGVLFALFGLLMAWWSFT